MKYRDRTTGQIYTLFELQQKFSNTSFPTEWDQTTFEYANVDPVTEVPMPGATAQSTFEYDGVQLLNGVWTEVWKEIPVQPEEITPADIEVKWNNIREQRNRLLSQTDYTQMSDTPIAPESRTAFVIYRQALRDVTSQSDPYSISWPAIPEYIKQN